MKMVPFFLVVRRTILLHVIKLAHKLAHKLTPTSLSMEIRILQRGSLKSHGINVDRREPTIPDRSRFRSQSTRENPSQTLECVHELGGSKIHTIYVYAGLSAGSVSHRR